MLARIFRKLRDRLAVVLKPFAGFFDFERIRSQFAGVFRPGSLAWAIGLLALILVPPAFYAAPTLDYPDVIVGEAGAARTGQRFEMPYGDGVLIVHLDGVKPASRERKHRQANREALAGLLNGRLISCRRRRPDANGLYVARCRFSDGRDIAAELVRAGHARENCFMSGNAYNTCAPVPAAIGFVWGHGSCYASEYGLRALRRATGWVGRPFVWIWAQTRWLFIHEGRADSREGE